MKTRAAVLYEMKKPPPYAQSQPLVIEELELEGPGPGEVLVEIAGAGLCHSDLSLINGTRPRALPIVMGHEAAGIVREVGPGVHDLRPDDHVVFSYVPMCGRCIYCATGRPALCEPGTRANVAGTLLNGKRRFRDAQGREINHHVGVSGYSQYTIAAQESLIKIDPAIPLEKAALFGCAIVTGVGSVVNTAGVQPGMSVAIFGMGGVGLSAVMGARLAGAHPIIAVDLLESKLDLARQMGASHTVNARQDDPVEAIRELTGGGAHYTFDAVGNEKVLLQAYQATRRAGTTVAIGLPAPDRVLSVPVVSIIDGERVIKGAYMGSCIPRRDIPRFLSLYQAGLLPVDMIITRTITLDEINAAFDALAQGEEVRQILRFT